MFIAINTKVDGQRGAQNPANSLVRYQLMELLIRVAKDKYSLLPNVQLAIRVAVPFTHV